MKATQQQYEEAVRLYEEGSCGDVYAYAEKLGIDEWSECVLCDAITPDCHDGACFVCGSPKKKYKIQMPAPFGWADLKESEDDGATYQVVLFDTKAAAEREVRDLKRLDPGSTHRIVESTTPADCDLY